MSSPPSLPCGEFPSEPGHNQVATLPVIVYVDYVYFALASFIVIVSTARFFYYRRIFVRLQKRSALYLISLITGVALLLVGDLLSEAIQQVCWWGVLFRSLVLPVSALSISLRILDHYNRYVLAQALMGAAREQSSISAADSDGNESLTQIQGNTPKFGMIRDAKALLSHLFYFSIKDETLGKEIGFVLSSDSGQRIERVVTMDGLKEAHAPAAERVDPRLLRSLKALSSWKMQALIFVIMLSPFIIVDIVEFREKEYLKIENHCYDCTMTSTMANMIIIGAALIIIIGLLFSIRVRKYPDPFGTVREVFYVLQYGGVIALVGFILSRYIPFVGEHFATGWITVLGYLIMHLITTELQIWICFHDKFEKMVFEAMKYRDWQKQKDLNESDKVGVEYSTPGETVNEAFRNFEQLLENSEDRAIFEKHLVSEFAVENLSMFTECENFEKNFFDMNENTKRVRAKRIVDRFVRDTATIEVVNLADELRTSLIKEIDSFSTNPNQVVTVELFAEAKRELFAMLFGSYMRFVKSPLYKDTQAQAQSSPV